MLKKDLILGVVIALIIGGVLGFILGMAKIKQIPPKIEEKISVLKESDLMKSKVLRGWTATASGKVTEISGRILTLASNGDSLKISIMEEAKIFRAKLIIVPPEETLAEIPPEPEEIDFKDIKIGDRVYLMVILIDNELKGVDVSVMSEERIISPE